MLPVLGKWESGDEKPAGEPAAQGWKWAGSPDEAWPGDPYGPTGGRFDIGPGQCSEPQLDTNPLSIVHRHQRGPLAPEFQASGPDMRQGGHKGLFFGSWHLEMAEPGNERAVMLSEPCAQTGLQLVRTFELNGADLTVRQVRVGLWLLSRPAASCLCFASWH